MNTPIKKEAGSSKPDGYTETKCSACGAEYFVPDEIISENAAFICPECAQAQANAVDESKAAAQAALKG